MDWKAILALAVLVVPVAYCVSVDEAARRDADARKAIACMENGGSWSQSWGGRCEVPND